MSTTLTPPGDNPGSLNTLTNPGDLLTVAETAAIARTPDRAVRHLIESGALPSVRLSPRRIRVRRSDLEAFLDAATVPATRRPGA